MVYTTETRFKNQSSSPINGPTEIILHSLGNAYNFEGGVGWLTDPSNPLEAHFAIRADGHRVQIVPTDQRADANYNANARAISIETDSSIEASEPWTDDQVASIIELCVQLIRQYPTIEAVQCPGPYDPGIGWHIMWGSPGAWTPAAKVCPGPARIEQVKNVIIPGVQAVLNAPTQPTEPPEETDMPMTEEEMDKLVEKIWTRTYKQPGSSVGGQSMQSYLGGTRQFLEELPARVAGIVGSMFDKDMAKVKDWVAQGANAVKLFNRNN